MLTIDDIEISIYACNDYDVDDFPSRYHTPEPDSPRDSRLDWDDVISALGGCSCYETGPFDNDRRYITFHPPVNLPVGFPEPDTAWEVWSGDVPDKLSETVRKLADLESYTSETCWLFFHKSDAEEIVEILNSEAATREA